MLRAATLDDLLSVRTIAAQNALALSPDGSLLACPLHHDRDRRYRADLGPGAVPGTALGVHLAVIDIASSHLTELGWPGATTWAPSWRPNSQQLAFYAAEDDQGPVHLYLWDGPDGSIRRVSNVPIMARGFAADRPAWTWDGRGLCVPVRSTSVPARAPQPVAVTVLESPAPTSAELGRLPRALWADIAIIDAATGAERRLVRDSPAHSAHPSPGMPAVLWSEIPFQSDPSRFETERVLHLWRADEDREVARWMDHGSVHHPPRWAPDGHRFAAVVDGQALVWDADQPDLVPKRLTLPQGRTTEAGFLLWAADGGSVVLWSGGQLWNVAIDGAAEPWAASGRTVTGVLGCAGHGWLPAGALGTARDDETRREALIRLADGAVVEEGEWEYAAMPFSSLHEVAADVTPDGAVAVYATRSADDPGDILWVHTEGACRLLADLNAHLADVDFGKRRVLRFTAEEGSGQAAVVRLPPGWAPGKPSPTVVIVYPGEHPSRIPHRFAAGVEALFTANGYAVLLPDIPYDSHASADPAEVTAKATLNAVDEAVRLGLADPERLAVYGHSYGGYGVLTLLCRTDRFRAAIASAAASDLVSMYGSMPGDPGAHPGRTFGIFWCETGQAGMGGPPWQRTDRYVANSPVFHLDRITTPLLLIAGQDDTATPWTQAGEVFVGLRRLGRVCTLLVYRGETHVPDRWSESNRRDLATRELQWLRSHLSDGISNLVGVGL